MSTSETSGKGPAGEVTFAREGVQLLPAGVLRLRHAIFQSVTNMAPAAAIVYDFPAQATVAAAGAALVLSNVVALVGVVLIAFSVIEFSRKLPSAGGYFTYIARGLGPHAGAYTGWTFFLYAMVLPAEVTIIWSGITQALVLKYIHIHVSWIIFEAIMVGVVGFFGYTGVRRSARTAMIAGGIEILIFVALSVGWLVHPASPVSFKPFLPGSSPTGWSGVLGFGLVFGILNFVGFEAAAPLGEETREPRRNVPRAVMGAAVAIGVLYVFVSFATVFGWGFSGVAKGFATNAAPYNVLASRLWGPAWIFVYLAITNSSLACSLAISNQAARVLYAMGRIELLPRVLGKVHPRHNTPYRAVVAQTTATLLIAVVAGLIWGTESGFLVLATTLTIGAIIVYALGNIALTVFYRREHRGEFSVVKHLALPLIALALLVYVLYRTVWPVPAYPLNVPAYLSIVWLVLGFGFVLYLARRARGGLRAAGQLFTQPGPDDGAPQPHGGRS
jgi:amino acid transporter